MKLNDSDILRCVLKTKFLKKKIERIERNCKECHWMSRDAQEELTNELEYVNSLLGNVCKSCSELSTKQEEYK